MIQIEGLNQRQRVIADVMWAMNGKEEVMSFIQSLPNTIRQEAETVLQMMLWAIWDDVAEIQQETIDVIDSVAR